MEKDIARWRYNDRFADDGEIPKRLYSDAEEEDAEIYDGIDTDFGFDESDFL